MSRIFLRERHRTAGYPIGLICITVLTITAPTIPAQAQRVTPYPEITPGAIDPNVTEANTQSTICVAGYADSVRPPEAYTANLKREQLDVLGLPRSALGQFEEDYLIPLELGGAPKNPRNLWLEPRSGPWSARDKDKLEERLHYLVCQGRVRLAQAQREIATNWVAAFIKYVWRNEPPSKDLRRRR